MHPCPLCQANATSAYHHDGKRQYLSCGNCSLVFADSVSHLDLAAEKQIYDMHENNPDDMGYRNHLNKLAKPLLAQLNKGMQGLDYGSGPGPTLSIMMGENGIKVQNYDPIYANNKQLLSPKQPYDFITMTEVIEHIYQPSHDLEQLWQTLGKDGWLGIMTGLSESHEHFANWHYTRDPTHVCFYSKDTFTWLADKFNAKLSFPSQDVIILQKRS